MRAAPPLQPLFHHLRAFAALVDREVVRDDRHARLLAVLQVEHDRPAAPTGLQLLAAPTPVPCLSQSELEALGQEVEHVEDGGLATAIRPQQHRHWGEVVEFDLVQRPIIFDTDRLDARNAWAGGVAGGVHVKWRVQAVLAGLGLWNCA